MARAYIITSVDVSDPEAYARCSALATQAMTKFNARVLARGGRCEALEGAARSRNVILEFEDYETARAYYHSVEYQNARTHRLGGADFHMTLVEGA